jgi:hypothetical protein
MKTQIDALRARFAEELGRVDTQEKLEELRVAFLGKKGEVTGLLKGLRDLSPEEKKQAGQLINELKTEVEIAIARRGDELRAAAEEAAIRGAKRYNPTVPSNAEKGSYHPITLVQRELEEIFTGMKAALSREDLSDCYLTLPPHFTMTVEYNDWNKAHSYSFYPGATLVDAKTVKFESDDYYEVMRFMHFCL